jgi:F420H(2)-dependent quinone reductase
VGSVSDLDALVELGHWLLDALISHSGRAGFLPGWVYNLRAFPDAEVQVGPEKIQVHAREAGDGERQRLWPEAARYHPAWGRFQQRTLRTLPIVILTPRRG